MTTKKDEYYRAELKKVANSGFYDDEQKDLIISLSEYDGDDIESAIFYNDNGGVIHEIADAAVDIYHNERFKWLAKDFNNAEYIEDAIKEYGYNFDNFDLSDIIALGQFKYYYDALNGLIDDLKAEIKEYDENGDEDSDEDEREN